LPSLFSLSLLSSSGKKGEEKKKGETEGGLAAFLAAQLFTGKRKKKKGEGRANVGLHLILILSPQKKREKRGK